MPLLVVQLGHVPRTTGFTGTAGEQQVVTAIGAEIRRLKPAGWDLRIINADESSFLYQGDAFIALHCDGGAISARGASVGYKTPEGAALAQRWKAAYSAQGFPGGWRNDNYTTNLSGYYGFSRCLAQGNRACIVVEHGFLTNPHDAAWIKANYTKCAQAVWIAVAGQSGVAKVPVNLPAHPAGWQVFHQLYNPTLINHFYTSDNAESLKAQADGYEYQGEAWRVSLTDATNKLNLHRFTKPTGHHFYTANEGEAASLKATPHWVYNGVVAKVGTGGVQVARFYRNASHFYSPTQVPSGWTRDGIAFGCGIAITAAPPKPVEPPVVVPPVTVEVIPPEYLVAMEKLNEITAIINR